LIRERGRLLAGREVLVVDHNGDKQDAPISIDAALAMAKDAGLDLVLVAESSTPPVCRIMDYGKLQYDHKKRIRDQKKTTHANKLKEVKFRLRIEKHDYDYKINHAIDFLGKGYKVKASLMFRGREMAHKNFGFELIKNVVADLEKHGKPDADPKAVGRNITVTFAPVKKGKH
jgi:translation initiation factor IF-3